ncbi:hypothetical protein PM082_001221 [Marasmius tenuissimus]|nr:hypothetical protein PM082_001221 [Marasmius tenuissimus]
MYRAPYESSHMDEQPEDRPVLPSISHIFENRNRAPGSLTLPPLPSESMHRIRSETWPQYQTVPDEYSMHPNQNQYEYTSSNVHVSPPDPHASAMRTDLALSALRHSQPRQQTHPYSTQRDPYAYSQAASSSRAGEYMMDSPMSYATARGTQDYPSVGPSLQRSRSYHSYDDAGMRQYTSSPNTYRHANMYGQSTLDNSASNAKHQCKYCGKRFSRPSGLKIHMTTHNGEKPYVCPEEGCHRAFSVRSNMRRHVRIVHQNAPQDNIPSDSSEDGDSRREASV